MKKPKIKKGLSRLGDLQLIAAIAHIENKLEGNPHFPDPVPSLAELKLIREQFNKAVNNVRSGDKTDVSLLLKNRLRTELMEQTDRLFGYINNTSTDITVLTGSGFPLAKETARVGTLTAPENLLVQPSGAGKIKLGIDKVAGAVCYLYQYTFSPSPETENWSHICHTRIRLIITGLVPGTQYKFRVCAIGTKGQGEWSNAVNCYAC